MNIFRWVMAVILTAGLTEAALPARSDHRTMQIVPALGKVAIDGVLSPGEWDTSGRIHVYASSKKRHEYSADFSTMWDKDNLYIGINWQDKTPMVNNVDGRGAPYDGWQSDALQLRFMTSGPGVGHGMPGYKAIHMDAFYSSQRDYTSAALSYNWPMSGNAYILRGPGKAVVDEKTGFAMTFKLREDGKGYVQEIRIPWTMLYTKAPEMKAGVTLRLTGEFYWGKPEATKWPMFFHQEPMRTPDRTNTYKSPGNWGEATLIGENNIKTTEPSVADFDANYRMQVRQVQGVYPIRFEVPATAERFTVAIDNTNGVRVRNLVGNELIDGYMVEDRGDTKVIEVLWDGRLSASYNYNWDEFVGYAAGEIMENDVHGPKPAFKVNMAIVEPGTYVARCLVHDGLRLYHEGSFYNPGNPSWPSESGKGGWLGDHHPPNWVSSMPPTGKSTKGVVFLSSPGGECGVPFIGVDREGEKLWSWLRSTGRVFCHTASDTHVFFGFKYAGRLAWGKIDPDTGKQVRIGTRDQDQAMPAGSGDFAGMSVHGKTLAIATSGGGILLYDTETADPIRQMADVKGVSRIAFTADGKFLYGIQGGKVVRVGLADGAVEVIALPGIASVAALALDSADRLLISDPATKTVKIFENGRQIAEVGEPGGHLNGPFNKQRMNLPHSIAVEERTDGGRRLWAVEAGHWFRRISVWNIAAPAQTAFYRHYVGNTGYQGSGGSVSDDDPTIGLYRGVMFKVDYPNATYEPLEIMGVGDWTGERGFGNGYHFWSDVSGARHEYYCADGGLHVRARDGSWKKCPSVGNQKTQWGYRTYKDLRWYMNTQVFVPTGFDADGAPLGYKPEPMPGAAGREGGSPRVGVTRTKFGYMKQQRIDDGPNPLRVTWGFTHMVGYDNEGNYRWKYPMFWYGVHGASTAPIARPGQIIGFIKDTGKVEVGDHTFLGVRGYKGQDFIVRDDGLYVGEFFSDFRETDFVLPDDKHIHGMDITDATLSEEIYSGMMAKQSDGKIRITYGHTDVRVARAEGLETVRELPSHTIRVDEGNVAQFVEFLPTQDEKIVKYVIKRGAAFDAVKVVVEEDALALREVTRSAEVPRVMLRYDDTNLYLAYVVKDPTAWQHPGDAFQTLFKSGDAVGFQHNIGTPHGTRIVMAEPDGKATAVVHRPRGPGSAHFAYTSPVRTVDFAYVAMEPTITYQVVRGEGGYTLVAQIPWKTLGAEPKSGMSFKGDLEVVFGGELRSHVKTVLRWQDAVDSLYDLPTESEIWPRNFGTFTLE